MRKEFIWDSEKNERLKLERNIDFETIVMEMNNGNLLDDMKHPNEEKYPGQRIFIVEFKKYAYMVPYIEKENELILITIIPSRKMTKKYL